MQYLFADAVGPHGAPFVVVAFQPDFEQIPKAAVGRHVLRRQVAMIVEDGLIFGIFDDRAAAPSWCEEKIFVDE